LTAHHRRPGLSPSRGADADEARRRAEAAAAAERRSADRFARLHSVSSALSAAVTPAEVAAAITVRGAELPGACGCAVGLLRDGASELLVFAARGSAGMRQPALPLCSPLAIATAARERRAVFVFDDASRDLLWDGRAAPAGSPVAVAAMPLEGRAVLGALAIGFTEPPLLDEEERAFMQAFSHACGQALERARLYEAERQARLEAQHAEETARRAAEVQERLVGVVGHDLRTPLAAIRMSTELLMRRRDLPAEQARVLARIASSAARMAGIIRDLLDFTRVRCEGGIPIHSRRSDLSELARQAVGELQSAYPGRDMILDLPESAPVVADPDRLAQAISNLVANALQHGPRDACVTVAVRGASDAVELRVHNEGPPIRPDLQQVIFEPFRQGYPGGEAGSVGLGLFIVREVMRAHGGSVEVRSTASEGTAFTIRLPACATPDEARQGVPDPERH
jgi:signal transduction histidine kinase